MTPKRFFRSHYTSKKSFIQTKTKKQKKSEIYPHTMWSYVKKSDPWKEGSCRKPQQPMIISHAHVLLAVKGHKLCSIQEESQIFIFYCKQTFFVINKWFYLQQVSSNVWWILLPCLSLDWRTALISQKYSLWSITACLHCLLILKQ